MGNNKKSLKDKIEKEMVVDYANAIEKNFDLAKKLLNITSEGKVDISNKDKFEYKDKILLYLIGKLYAKEARRSESEFVGNEELANELGINERSLRVYLSRLRKENKIKKMKEGRLVYHKISPNLIERTLKRLTKIIE